MVSEVQDSSIQISIYGISWCKIVLDLLDLTFAELFYGFYHMNTLKLGIQYFITITKNSPYTLMVILIILTFSSNKEGKLWIIVN